MFYYHATQVFPKSSNLPFYGYVAPLGKPRFLVDYGMGG